MKKTAKKTTNEKVISYRRSCKGTANSTGLSHYILTGDKKK